MQMENELTFRMCHVNTCFQSISIFFKKWFVLHNYYSRNEIISTHFKINDDLEKLLNHKLSQMNEIL